MTGPTWTTRALSGCPVWTFGDGLPEMGAPVPLATGAFLATGSDVAMALGAATTIAFEAVVSEAGMAATFAGGFPEDDDDRGDAEHDTAALGSSAGGALVRGGEVGLLVRRLAAGQRGGLRW